MADKDYSFEMQGFFNNLHKLIEETELGNFEAGQRLEAIKKLANPIYDFSPSHYQRILDKKLPIPVTKGLRLYKKMNQLTTLLQPIGKRKGTACAVRRVDYKNLTWEEFLELRGSFTLAFISEGMKLKNNTDFNGLDILNDEQKELYERIKVYFGNKKKPTLQSLAMNLLSEDTDGKDFSERSLYIYLEAIKKHQKRRKTKTGFNVIDFSFHSVASFHNKRTIRDSIDQLEQATSKLKANLFKDKIPNFKDSFKPLIQTTQISELMRTSFPSLTNLSSQFKKKDSSK